GRLGDRLGRRRRAGRTSVQMFGLVLMLPTLVWIGAGNSLALLFAPLALYGVGVGLYQANLWTTTFEVVPPQTRSTAIGLLNVASGVFGFASRPLVGVYEKHGGSVGVALAWMSVLLVVNLAVLVWSCRRLLPRDYR